MAGEERDPKVYALHSLLNNRSEGVLEAQGRARTAIERQGERDVSNDHEGSSDYGDLPDLSQLPDVDRLTGTQAGGQNGSGYGRAPTVADSDLDAEGESEDDDDNGDFLAAAVPISRTAVPHALPRPSAEHDYVRSSSLIRTSNAGPSQSVGQSTSRQPTIFKKAADFMPKVKGADGASADNKDSRNAPGSSRQVLAPDSDPVREDPLLKMRHSIKDLSYSKSGFGLPAKPSAHSSVLKPASDPDQTIASIMKSHPTASESTVRALWQSMGGNIQLLHARLDEMDRLIPIRRPEHRQSPQKERTSAGTFARNDESHSRRQEAKAKSAIYANRQSNHLQSPRQSIPIQSPRQTIVIQSPRSGEKAPPSEPKADHSRKKKLAGKFKRRQISDDESEELAESSGASSSDPDDGGAALHHVKPLVVASTDLETLQFFNNADQADLIAMLPIDATQAATLVSLRPFAHLDDARTKLGKAKGISGRLIDHYEEAMEGYLKVDEVLAEVQRKGMELKSILQAWTGVYQAKNNLLDLPRLQEPGLENGTAGQETYNAPTRFHPMSPEEIKTLPLFLQKAMSDFLQTPPARMSDVVKLKEYQLLGMNWLRTMHKRGLSCILADEMGLGKTAQVIAFIADIITREPNNRPHLIVVPSSTLENWMREFAKFCPDINVRAYYGNQKERQDLRQDWLYERSLGPGAVGRLDVAVTTYNLATGSIDDRKFLRKFGFRTCTFDEGHMLKNAKSQRYEYLMGLGSHWRLLLTGTPLQNNLLELVSLLNFILPEIFSEAMPTIQAVFKVRPDSKMALLSQSRVGRAKQMISPFCLRRQKHQVLKDLPKKLERIEYCDMTARQRAIYVDTVRQSRKAMALLAEQNNIKKEKREDEQPVRTTTDAKEAPPSSSNILMDLRKAAIHPMLFRREYTDAMLPEMAKSIMREDTYVDAKKEYIIEDMTYMTDWELHRLCCKFPKTMRRYMRDSSAWMEAGKIRKLESILPQYKKSGERVLIFSQFTSVLDILEAVLETMSINWKRIDGQTAVDQRQLIIDEFGEDKDCTVFLLSTKAGGLGLNLTMANIVILFDLDYNPHNDAQAEDRAYRLGQEKDVHVIKLITRDSVEENVLALGKTKLALDQSVSGVLQNRPKGVSGVGTPTISDLWQAPAGPGQLSQTGEETEDATGSAVQSSLVKMLLRKWQDPSFVDELEAEEKVTSSLPRPPPSPVRPATSTHRPSFKYDSETSDLSAIETDADTKIASVPKKRTKSTCASKSSPSRISPRKRTRQ